MTLHPVAVVAWMILTVWSVHTVLRQAAVIRRARHALKRHIALGQWRDQPADIPGHFCGCGRPSHCQPAREAL